MRWLLQAVVAFLLLSVTVVTVLVCLSGYRVTSAMNYGALRARVEMCIDAKHMALRAENKVPQRIVDQVLTRQIWARYYYNPKRRLPHSATLLSSQVGWQAFWSAKDRKRIYESLEQRMRPCPGATKRFREQRAKASTGE